MTLRRPCLADLEHPLKTGVAAVICMLVDRAIRLEHGYWSVISAIIVMQVNLGGSIRAGIDRLIGTAIGALLGALTYAYLGRTPVAIGIALAVTIFVCSWLGLKASFRLAGVTASIVLLVGQEGPVATGVDRFIDVAVGVLVALAVSLVWPSRASQDLRASLARTFAECNHLLQSTMVGLHSGTKSEDVEQQKANLRSLGAANLSLLADAGREPGPGFVRGAALLVDAAQRTSDHLFGMGYAANAMREDTFHVGISELLQQTIAELSSALTQISDAILNRTAAATFQGLENALSEFETEFAARRSRGESLHFDTDELLRFYSLIFRLRETIHEVHHAARLITAINGFGDADSIEQEQSRLS
jgi:uncharacterized membrane protein YccC